MEPDIAIGRIVLYKLTSADATFINRRRDDYATTINPKPGHPWVGGAQAHVGNGVLAGESYPAIVVRVWPPGVYSQLQVFLDGNDTYWATSVEQGDTEGTWAWPV